MISLIKKVPDKFQSIKVGNFSELVGRQSNIIIFKPLDF
jgi:hypothetical protein